MALRRIIASFLVFLFVLVALPTFLVFGMDRTFLEPVFYVDNVTAPAYELLVNAVSYNIYTKSPLIQKYFQQDDVHKIVSETIPLDLFQKSMQNFSSDFALLKTDPTHALSLDLKPYHSSLVQISQQLAIHIFQALPQCKTAELPEFNEDGIATCVPGGTDYNVVAGPLAQLFQTGVSNALPDTIDLSLARDQNGSIFTTILSSADRFRFYAIGVLMVLIVALAFVIYRPFTVVIRYEGMAFLFSGFLGFLMTLVLGQIPLWFVQNYADKNEEVVQTLGGVVVLAQYFLTVFSVFIGEVQKISFVFFALGAVLLGLYFYLLRKEAKRLRVD
jgi:hypothetical protein